MSQESVEIARQLTAAFSDGDLNAIVNVVDPEFEMDWTRSKGPDQGLYRGLEGVAQWIASIRDAFEDFEIVQLEHLALEGGVISPARVTGRGRFSGVEVDAEGATYLQFRAGRPIRITLYQSKEEALEAAGLEE
jgi:ketosteroid isomerase-like protein